MDTDDDLFDECLSSGSSNCTICSTNGCNNEIYPSDWLASLRCDSANDADCALSPNSYSGYCRTYSKDDACVTSLTNYFHSLLFCNESNCNSLDNLPVPHKCLFCDSSEDPNCATDPSKIELIGNCGVLPYSSCQTRISIGSIRKDILE